MPHKPIIIGYVPPPTFGCARAFLENILRYKTRERLLLYSDHPYGSDIFPIAPVDKMPPDALVDEFKRKRPAAISNALFHVGVRLAIKNGATHMLYLESDCRVKGDYWDEKVFNEFFSLQFPVVAAGTLVAWNMPNGGLPFVRRTEQFVAEHGQGFWPICQYGAMPYGENPNNPAIFPNGALAVYSLEWMSQLFDLSSMIAVAKERAFDYMLGQRLVERFGLDAFELVAHLSSVLSTYGRTMGSESDLMGWLKEGKAHCVHQVKSSLTI